MRFRTQALNVKRLQISTQPNHALGEIAAKVGNFLGVQPTIRVFGDNDAPLAGVIVTRCVAHVCVLHAVVPV